MAVKRKRKNKKRRRFVFAAGFFVIMVLSLITASLTIFFNIREIAVTGGGPYPDAAVIEASGLKTGDNLFRINKFEIQEQIERKLPYVEKAEINRHFPEKVEIAVTPAKETAVISNGNTVGVVSASSKLLKISDDISVMGKLPVIKNAKPKGFKAGETVEYEDGRTAERLKTLFEAFSRNGYDGKITAVDMSKSYNIVFEYEARVECQLGSLEYIDRKLELIRKIIGLNPPNQKAVINAQDYSNISYKRKEESSSSKK